MMHSTALKTDSLRPRRSPDAEERPVRLLSDAELQHVSGGQSRPRNVSVTTGS
jgi:hypothetical protein